jgi:hypothetical protein
MEISDELATYLRPGPFSIIVATCDQQLAPNAVRAWGPKVLDDRRTVEVFVGRAAALRLVENVRTGGAIAMAIGNMTTFQGVQLKGRCVEIGEPEADDHAGIRAHNEQFVAAAQRIGMAEQAARGMLVTDVIRLRLVPEALFDQTPGPEAGTRR